MKTYKLNEIENKRILGRNIAAAGETEKPLALFWGASALEINVKATEVWILISGKYDNYEPWISIEVNGFPTNRFIVPVEPAWICIARNLNPQNENLISIYKDCQAMSGDSAHSLFIHEIGLDEKGIFRPLKKRKLNIEFIGDSITSGEGLAGSPKEMDWITQWMSASKTYAVQTAKALDADFSVISQCGWGICWGWDGNPNSAIPLHYDNVCSVMSGDYQEKIGAQEKYSFPIKNDFVIINLGTNDNGAFFQPPWKNENGVEHILHVDENKKILESDGNILKKGYKDFLKNIRFHNPAAKIICTWGMIKLNAVPEYILKAIEEYKKESCDVEIYSLEFDSMEDVEVLEEDKGSRGHPGPKTHNMAAEKLINFIKSIN